MVSMFETPGQWLKGNIHTHTTQSDGAIGPAENIRWHEEHGYDVVSITDHDRVTDPSQFCDPSILVLLGTELSLGLTQGGGPFHLIACGLPADFEVPPVNSLRPQQAIDQVTSSGAACFVAHPHWSSSTMEELAALTGYHGLEVFNTGCDWENRTGRAEPYWDDMLRRGRRVWGLASDDSHWRYPDYGGGWVMLRAAERSVAAVREALKSGQFYATCGPTIDHVSIENGRLRITCSHAEAIYWSEGRRGWSIHAEAGKLLTEAEFTINAQRYVRVQIVDEQGRWAWSNPFFLSPPDAF